MANKIEYSVDPPRPDGPELYRVVRSQGPHVRSIAEYSDQNAALLVRDALNTSASFEE